MSNLLCFYLYNTMTSYQTHFLSFKGKVTIVTVVAATIAVLPLCPMAAGLSPCPSTPQACWTRTTAGAVTGHAGGAVETGTGGEGGETVTDAMQEGLGVLPRQTGSSLSRM